MPNPEQDNSQGPSETKSAASVDGSATERTVVPKSRFEELQQQLNAAQQRRDELSSGPFAKLRGNDRPLDQEIDQLTRELRPLYNAADKYRYLNRSSRAFDEAIKRFHQHPNDETRMSVNSRAREALLDIRSILDDSHLADIVIDPQALTELATQIRQKASATEQELSTHNRQKWTRRSVSAALAGGAIYAFSRSRWGHELAKSYRESEHEQEMKRLQEQAHRQDMQAAITPTPEAPVQTELQKNAEQLLQLFAEIRADKDLAAEQAIFLLSAAKEHGAQPVIEFVKAINKKGGDSVDLDTAAMVASEAIKAGKTPEQTAETITAFSKLYSNKYKDEGLVAQMAVLSIKYNLEPQKVIEDYKNLHQSLNAAGTTVLQNIYYQGFGLDQIKENFANAQKLTEHDHQQYDNGIDEAIAAASLLSGLDQPKLVEQFKIIRHQIDANHDATALKLALVTMAGNNTDEVVGQYRYVDKKLDDLETDLQEASASQIVLNAVSDNSTVPGFEDLANSSGGLDPNFIWSIYGPNGLSHP